LFSSFINRKNAGKSEERTEPIASLEGDKKRSRSREKRKKNARRPKLIHRVFLFHFLPTTAHSQAELREGDRLQDYPDYYRVLKADDGTSVALSSFEGKQPVVLAFYPAASTPGCTKEMCSIRDSWAELTATKAAVFGISGDEPAKNAAFRKANNLPFRLLSDSGNFLRKSFGIKGDLLGLLPGRQTIVVDKKGTVVKVFNSQFEVDKHVEAALEALKKL
jgi:thioredoxin-dependent peroxiredoxin